MSANGLCGKGSEAEGSLSAEAKVFYRVGGLRRVSDGFGVLRLRLKLWENSFLFLRECYSTVSASSMMIVLSFCVSVNGRCILLPVLLLCF